MVEHMGRGSGRERGFAYVMLLLAVAVVGLVSAASISVGVVVERRSAEQQLLVIGMEFQTAIRNYASTSERTGELGLQSGPRALQDLLRDPRAPGLRRYLRQIYDDPMTGNSVWGSINDSEGRLIGIYSLADGMPIRREGFSPELANFEQATSYRQWVFGLAAAHGR